jgi:hypothetical protein
MEQEQMSDAETRVKKNRERQKNSKDVHIDGGKQVKYWRDLWRIDGIERKMTLGQ